MKRNLILILLLFQLAIGWANPIDVETAQRVAINFMSTKVGMTLVVKNLLTEEYNGDVAYYVVNFHDGGWVMVSADNAAVPVLGYSLSGEYYIEDEKPDGFNELTSSYKEEIASAKVLKSSSIEFSSKWEELLNESKLKSSSSYTAGTNLLNVAGRGQVQWRQATNNYGGCTPAYNAYCPTGSKEGCKCGRKTVGCGAVAMGQIMWYWQWPQSSSYRTYNWQLMPYRLTNSSTTAEGEAIAHLLKDCGNAADITYWCSGSWTTTNKIVDAFKDKFKYKGVKKHLKTDWEYGSAWEDLLRSELDNERPILYRGDKSDLSTSKHFFVIDGYDASDPDYFHFNFGWGGASYNLAYLYLNDITPSSYNFNKNQMAIVGISPTYTEVAPDDANISDVSYTNVTGVNTEEAQINISLPATGKDLTVENGGELTLEAGNSIKIKSGFHAKSGSKFRARINPDFTEEMDINVPTWYNAFSPNGDGINDVLKFKVYNADSYEFQVYDRSGIAMYQSAGLIEDNIAEVWDGRGAYGNSKYESYACIIRFKNNYGRSVDKAYFITVGDNRNASLKSALISTSVEEEVMTNEDSNTFVIYPNPSNGKINMQFSSQHVNSIKVYNIQGTLCYQTSDINQSEITIDLSYLANGVYMISAELDQNIVTRKVILQK